MATATKYQSCYAFTCLNRVQALVDFILGRRQYFLADKAVKTGKRPIGALWLAELGHERQPPQADWLDWFSAHHD